MAAGFGVVTSFLFALWPLAKAEEVRAANLFRQLNSMPAGRPRGIYLGIAAVTLMVLAGLAFAATRDLMLTASFIGGSLAATVDGKTSGCPAAHCCCDWPWLGSSQVTQA